jgi:hypothetical protein
VTILIIRDRDATGLDVGDVIVNEGQLRASVHIRSAQDLVRFLYDAPARSVIRAVFERRGARYYTDFSIG